MAEFRRLPLLLSSVAENVLLKEMSHQINLTIKIFPVDYVVCSFLSSEVRSLRRELVCTSSLSLKLYSSLGIFFTLLFSISFKIIFIFLSLDIDSLLIYSFYLLSLTIFFFFIIIHLPFFFNCYIIVFTDF